MKTRFLLIMTLMLSLATRSMAYGFYVGGVQITSSNYQDIIGAIQSADPSRINVNSGGSITYVPSTKTLTLKNVEIRRDGSSNRGITNDSESNLTVVFEGTVWLNAANASPILCKANTTLKCANGGKAHLYTSGSDGLTANGCTITIQDADMSITSNSKLGIMSDDNNGYVTINNSKVTVTAKTGAVSKLKRLSIEGASTVTFYGNSSDVTVHDLQDFVLDNFNMKIDSPPGAYFDSTKKAIVTSVYPNGYIGTIKFITTALQVNATNFPDANFRSYISSFPDTNGDGYLTLSERSITSMNISQRSIQDLTGIEHFTELNDIDCSYNSLGELTLSGLNKLKELSCVQCGLSTLTIDLPSLTKLNCVNNNLTVQPVSTLVTPNLESFDCRKNKIKKLNFSGFTYLKEVSCDMNDLTSLNISNCTALTTLSCSSNQLTSLNISGCYKLVTLDCSNNKLTTITMSGYIGLSTISCYKNNFSDLEGIKELVRDGNGTLNLLYAYSTTEGNNVTLEDITDIQNKGWTVNVHYDESWYNVNDLMISINGSNFPGNSFRNYLKSQTYGSDLWFSFKEIVGITDMDVNDKGIDDLRGLEFFFNLKTLDCSNNPSLSTLLITDNKKLTELKCNNNSLTSLNVTKNTLLQSLSCHNNRLTYLDFSKNTSLVDLDCSNNKLKSLDVTNNKDLKELNCSYNELTSLNVTRQNNSLKSVICDNNKLSASAFQTVLSVYGDSNCNIFVQDLASSTEQNEFNTSLLALAKSNNWTPYYYDADRIPHEYDENPIATSIDAATAQEDTTDGDAPRYNLQGQHVGKDYRGVVIVNGRKVQVK